jgi:hypothetical protein
MVVLLRFAGEIDMAEPTLPGVIVRLMAEDPGGLIISCGNKPLESGVTLVV